MSRIITRSSLISVISNTIEDEDARNIAMQAVNNIYINEHDANMSEQEADFFCLCVSYPILHEHNPERFNQRLIAEEVNNVFLR